MQTFLFLKLSIVKHFPKVAVHTKESHSRGNLLLPNAFPREKLITMANKKMVVSTDREPLTLTRQPTSLILPVPPNRSAINGIDEASESFQFAIMHLPAKLKIPMKDSIGESH